MNKAARTHYPFLRNVLKKRTPLYSRKRINVAWVRLVHVVRQSWLINVNERASFFTDVYKERIKRLTSRLFALPFPRSTYLHIRKITSWNRLKTCYWIMNKNFRFQIIRLLVHRQLIPKILFLLRIIIIIPSYSLEIRDEKSRLNSTLFKNISSLKQKSHSWSLSTRNPW